MEDYAVVIENLTFQYAGAKAPTLRGVNLNIRRGEVAMLIGATGAGKSTLYMCLNGLIPHLIQGRMSGRVTVAGMDTATHGIAELSQKVGTVFQDPEVQIFSLTVEEELAFGPSNLGLSREVVLDRVRDAVTTVQLADLLEREPAKLSGGQQQSVAIGSVWTMFPEVLVLDEPTSNLDPQGSVRVLELIKRLNQEYGKTILIAEHKIDDVVPFADQVFVMHEGQIILDGTPAEVFSEAELLRAHGLFMPLPAELVYRLRAKGISLDHLPVTLEEAIAHFGALLEPGSVA